MCVEMPVQYPWRSEEAILFLGAPGAGAEILDSCEDHDDHVRELNSDHLLKEEAFSNNEPS